MVHSRKRDRLSEQDDEPCYLSLSPEPESEPEPGPEPESTYDADVDSDSELGSKTGKAPSSGLVFAAWGSGFEPGSDTDCFKHNRIIEFIMGLESPKMKLNTPPTIPDYYCSGVSPVSPTTIKRPRDTTPPEPDRPAKRLRREDPELALYDPVLAMLDSREQGAIWAVHFDPQLFCASPGPSHHVDVHSLEHVTEATGIGETELEVVTGDSASAAMRGAVPGLNSSCLAAQEEITEVIIIGP